MKLLILISIVSVVSCECDSYASCLDSFVNNFFKNVNSFEPSEVEEDTRDFVDFGRDNINKILSGVSGFLHDEINGSLDLDAEYHSLTNKNGTKIFVKTFVINDGPNFDLQDEIFDETYTDLADSYIDKESQIIKNVDSTESTHTDENSVATENIPIKNNNSSTTERITHSDKNIEENEIPDEDYNIDDNSTDYSNIDYIELYKDTTNEDIGYTTEAQIKDTVDNVKIKSHASDNRNKTYYHSDSCPGGTSDDVTTVYSWIAAIFVKNGADQFQYYCDGAILSPNVIITAASCVNSTSAEDIIVILGKTSLQLIQDSEKMTKIKEVIKHQNFSNTSDDLAILKTEDAIEISDTISIACLDDGDTYTDALTTGWAITGNLTTIGFYKEMSEECSTTSSVCGVYRNDITHCPSFGGIFAAKRNGWYLRGIRSTEVEDRAMCIHAPVHFTPLYAYIDWIKEYL
ncbi:ovochymase-2-like [Zerene cesonia]|uniref:ovochymase-2-like n=1 Tax=Zerene cesonia TaxID=33412 RepID=UPI0018E4DCEC|nr:ovochymase-2-like [Zerene cesonia]